MSDETTNGTNGTNGAQDNVHGTSVPNPGSPTDERMAPGEDGQTLTNRQGRPVYDNQNVRTVGSRGPTTLENYNFIEKITHFDRERIPERVVHCPRSGRARILRGVRHGGRRADCQIHPRQTVPGKRQVDAGLCALLVGDPRWPLAGNPARPARLCGEVLYRGWQLGFGGQQPQGLLYPGCHEVSRSGSRLQAGSGHQSTKWRAHLRLHQPHPGSDAHDHVSVLALGDSGQLSADAGLGR